MFVTVTVRADSGTRDGCERQLSNRVRQHAGRHEQRQRRHADFGVGARELGRRQLRGAHLRLRRRHRAQRTGARVRAALSYTRHT